MTKNPLYNALLASGYVGLVIICIFGASKIVGNEAESLLFPIAGLSVFVLSAAIMAYLFFYQPVLMLIDGERPAAIRLFLRTVGIFAATTALIFFISVIVTKSRTPAAVEPQKATYRIEGRQVTLGDTSSVGSADSPTGTTQYFGNEKRMDLNADGREDAVFLITDAPGGSGTFYYVVAALRTDAGYVGSKAFFVGDRIAPQNITVDFANGEGISIGVNYADRTSGESFVVRPSVGKTLWLRFDPKAMEFVRKD